MTRARITVIKRAFHGDVVAEFFPSLVGKIGTCSVVADRQSFVVEGPFPKKPDGFCDWAWTDIHKVVALTMMGANPTPGTEFSCCSDGLRPVTFRIERLENGVSD